MQLHDRLLIEVCVLIADLLLAEVGAVGGCRDEGRMLAHRRGLARSVTACACRPVLH